METFGSMERREKTEFILEQVALCIEKDDWTQAGILSRKIGTKFFARKPKRTPEQIEKDKKEREEKEKHRSIDDPPLEKEDDVTDLKLRYYEQQILLAKHEDKYLDACKHYRQVLDTESVEETPEQLHAVRHDLPSSIGQRLTRSRYSKEPSTTSSSHPTTMNSPIYFIVSTSIPVTPLFQKRKNSSEPSQSQNSCAGPWLPSASDLISAQPMFSLHHQTQMTLKLILDGKISESV